MAKRSPIFGSKEDGHQIGYVEGDGAFDLSGKQRCNYSAKTGNLRDKKSIVGHVSLEGKFVGISTAADELFLKPARDINSAIKNYPNEPSSQVVAIHVQTVADGDPQRSPEGQVPFASTSHPRFGGGTDEGVRQESYLSDSDDLAPAIQERSGSDDDVQKIPGHQAPLAHAQGMLSSGGIDQENRKENYLGSSGDLPFAILELAGSDSDVQKIPERQASLTHAEDAPSGGGIDHEIRKESFGNSDDLLLAIHEPTGSDGDTQKVSENQGPLTHTQDPLRKVLAVADEFFGHLGAKIVRGDNGGNQIQNAPLIEESELTTLTNLASKGSGPFSEEVERVFQILRYRVGLDEL